MLQRSKSLQRVSPGDTLDYAAFTREHRMPGDVNELHVFQKFYASRKLVTEGWDTYLNAHVSEADGDSSIDADACGRRDGSLILYFFNMGRPQSILQDAVEKVNMSENANAVILAPVGTDLSDLEETHPAPFDSGKAIIEYLGWFDDSFDETFRDTLHLIEVLGNETRMRMLGPLFKNNRAKKEYRTRINPKLVYQNLSVLQGAGLVEEAAQGAYELSPMGKSILGDFFAFLENTRRTLGSVSKEEKREVKRNG